MKNLSNIISRPSNFCDTVAVAIKLLNVKITELTIQRELESHPNYLSLLSVSDFFTKYGIDNLTARFAIERLVEMPTPFLAQLIDSDNKEPRFAVVKEINLKAVSYYDSLEQIWVSCELSDFKLLYNGIALIAEVSENAGENSYEEKKREQLVKNLLIILFVATIPVSGIVLSVFSLIQGRVMDLFSMLFFVGSIVGYCVGLLFMIHDLNGSHPIIQQICGSEKKISCDAVLNSKGSKLWGISWSWLGLSYFVCQILVFLHASFETGTLLNLLSFLSFIVLPYSLYSIYYQWRVARQWCKLCLLTQVLLLYQAAIASFGILEQGAVFYNLSFYDIAVTLIYLLVPLSMLSILIPAIKGLYDKRIIERQLNQIKSDPSVFEAILAKQKMIALKPEGLGVRIGNPNANWRIIKVSNPYCAPCANAHPVIDQIIENNPDVELQIIFTATNDKDDYLAPPVRHFLSIYEHNRDNLRAALSNWFSVYNMDYPSFVKSFPITEELTKQDYKLDIMSDWCNLSEITGTPTYFINNQSSGDSNYYQLPKNYSLSDLKYFLSA